VACSHYALVATERSQEIVQELKKRGPEYAFFEPQLGLVAIIGPGAPCSVTPTPYTRDDLERAVSDGLLEKGRLFGSCNLDTFVMKRPG
jgi:hypothetical protein